MKFLSIAGTIAMFLVGGGILTHAIAPLQQAIDKVTVQAAAVSGLGPLLGAIAPLLLDAVVGLLAGTLVLLAVNGFKKIKSKF